MRQRERTVALVVDGNRDAVQDDSEAVALFSIRNDGVREAVKFDRVSCEGISLAVEFFARDGDAAVIDALIAQVTSDFSTRKKPGSAWMQRWMRAQRSA